MSEFRKVIIVNDFAYVYGGASNVAITSAIELARRGHRVAFFCAVAPIDERLPKAGVEVVCLDQDVVGKDMGSLAAATKAIWNRSSAVRFEALLHEFGAQGTIVHIHGWLRSLSTSFVAVAMRQGAGLVVTVHDYFLACPNGGFYNYKTDQICTLVPLSGACLSTSCGPGGYKEKVWRCLRQGVQQTAGHLPSGLRHVITISPLSRDVIRPYLPEDCRIHEIGNPVEVEPLEAVDVANKSTFAFIGKVTQAKGAVLAAQAAQIADVDLLFLGDGDQRFEIERDFPLARFTGWISPQELKSKLSDVRATLFPSNWYEGQPLVILEAASRGIPCVVSDLCAGRDSIIDEETGLLFRGGDATHLAQQINRLKEDSFVARLGTAAHDKFWKDPNTPHWHVNLLESCYADIFADFARR
jgi:glycosyltransferase involved in cell wall biosynthesis